VDTIKRVKEGVRLLWEGDSAKIHNYMKALKSEDPLAWLLLEAQAAVLRAEYLKALRIGTRLLSRVGSDPYLTWFLFVTLGDAYRGLGEVAVAQNYLLRALEIAERTGDPVCLVNTRISLMANAIFQARYGVLYDQLKDFNIESMPKSTGYDISYLLATLETVNGRPEAAIRQLEFLEVCDPITRQRGMEIKGLALRLLNRLTEAKLCFIESAEVLTEFGSSYSAFLCAKALQITRFTGLESPPIKLIRKCLKLAGKGGWGEHAAAKEIEALVAEDDDQAAQKLYEAAQSYYRAHQPIEACLTGLASAFLAYKTTSPVFLPALRLISPLIPLHPGFKQDPILGRFLLRLEPLLLEETAESSGIKAYLIDELRVYVNGRELNPMGWRSKKAARAFIYLLLVPKHRIPRDHMFYLLWPRAKRTSKTSQWMYMTISTLRRELGQPVLISRKYNFYQLEGEVWTDLGEIENLVRLADATTDPAQKEEYLARARELAKGELLPEFPYDKHIEEYRQYYERLRKRLFGEG